MLTIKVALLHPLAVVPTKANPNDSGWDLTICEITPKRDKVFFFNTGIAIEPPAGYYTEVYPRSSIYKTDFLLANSVGIIDEGYRGPIIMPMRYVGSENDLAKVLTLAQNMVGKKVGQLILRQNLPSQCSVHSDLSDSARGTAGFGSSGK